MWNGLCGLFLKLEQGNLYNEINFDLPTNALDNVTSIAEDARGVRLPVESQGDRRRHVDEVHHDHQGQDDRSRRSSGPSDYRGNMAAGMIADCTDAKDPSTATIYDKGMTYRTPRSAWPTSPTARPTPSSSARP